MTFGHLENDNLEYAKNPVVIGGALTFNPTKGQYLSIGEKELHLDYPSEPAGVGKHWEEDGWNETGTDIFRKWKAVDDPVVEKRYSIPDLFFWLRGYDQAHPEAKKGQLVVDWLNSADLYTIAVTTRVVSESNVLFAPTLQQIKNDIGFTEEEVQDALEYA